MKLYRSYLGHSASGLLTAPSACAIGMFDGIHLGHQLVLENALRNARINNRQSVVFTFANHPQTLISTTPTELLSTLDERLEAFENLGFDAALVLDFTLELKNMPADDFVRQILLDALRVQHVSVGYDHRFGYNRMGDGAYLIAEGKRHGFSVDVVEPVRADDQIISSTLIRKLLTYGELAQANTLLGKPYHLHGTVETGVGRGRTIGFPTANLKPDENRLVPAQGVYAGEVILEGDTQPRMAVCNIGISPTFGDLNHPKVEIHLLDYQGDLYGKQMRFTFLHHLRPEQKFSSLKALSERIQQDCATAREILEA